MSEDLITNLYNAFDPFEPLAAGSLVYVDLQKVRGDANILRDLGHKILRSPDRNTCQLYAGHRGAGKSTELLRLKADLEKKGHFVVYFAADQGDIDPEDTQYTDILIACTRRLLEALTDADPQPLFGWISECWQDLKDLALTNISLEDLKVEGLIPLFGKLSATIRVIPTERAKIREKLAPHIVTLLDALNKFIEDGKRKLPPNQSKLVVIIDNLDRIVPVIRNRRNSHEEIFIDRGHELRGLDCHLVYTIPISLVYSPRVSDLRNIYHSDPLVLPIVMMEMPDGAVCEEGMKQIKEVIRRRVNRFAPEKDLEKDIFESKEVLERLCLMSGGYVRNLMLLIRSAFDHIDNLPITKQAAQRSITQARDIYRRTIEHQQWNLLAQVHKHKMIQNDDEHRKLLFNRCILQYTYFDQDGEMRVWYDVHPLIKDMVKSSLVSLDSKPDLLIPMDEASQIYEQLVSERKYAEASQVADKIYQMYEKNVESLKYDQDSNEYINAVAWSSYWKLRRDLYKSRSYI